MGKNAAFDLTSWQGATSDLVTLVLCLHLHSGERTPKIKNAPNLKLLINFENEAAFDSDKLEHAQYHVKRRNKFRALAKRVERGEKVNKSVTDFFQTSQGQ